MPTLVGRVVGPVVGLPAPPPTGSNYPSEVLADTPLAYWRLGEASGTTMVDASGNARNGVYVGTPTLASAGLLAGGTDNAVTFDGIDDAGTIASAAWMNVAAFTLEAIIKPSSVTGTRTIISRHGPGGSPFIFRLDADKLALYIRNTANTFESVTYTTGLVAGTRYHVAATYGAGIATIYVNGASVATATLGTPQTTNEPIIIGDSNDGTEYFAGVIDEVAFYGTALSATRIAAHNTAVASVTNPATVIVGTLATETDAALTGSATVGAVVVGGRALELDEGRSATGALVIIGGQAVETDTGLAGRAVTIVLGGTATELSSGVGGLVRVMPPVTPAPLIASGESRVVAQAFGPVTMQGSQPVYTISEASTVRARQRIVVDGVDVTYFRGGITPNVTYTLLSPLLYGPAQLDLPQVSACFERPGYGALTFLRPGAEVWVQRVINDVVVGTDYKGVIVAFDTSGRNLSVELGGEVSGRAALRDRQVPIFTRTNDIGRQIADAITDLGIPHFPHLGATTGIEVVTSGGVGHLEHIQGLVAKAWTRAGKQWTVMPDESTGVYETHRKDVTTIHATAFIDDAKTVANLRRDIAEEPNRIFVTGVTPSGRRVRFGVYPGLKQGPTPPFPGPMKQGDTGEGVRLLVGKLHSVGYLKLADAAGGYDADVTEAVTDLQNDAGIFDDGFTTGTVPGEVNLITWNALFDLGVTGNSLEWAHIEPAAQRRKVAPWKRSGAGGIMGTNPKYDPNRLKRDRTIDCGSGLTISQMREFARTVLHDSDDPNWVGDITFNTGALILGNKAVGATLTAADVMDARRLRPGMNLWLPQFDGGARVHVSACQVDGEGNVTTTVDTRNRDAMEVWEIITRNKESKRDPGRRRAMQHRSSTITKDSIGEWDEIGGILGQEIKLKPGWNKFEVVAAAEGTISRLRLAVQTVTTNGNVISIQGHEFACAVFGKPISVEKLTGITNKPLTNFGGKKWEKATGDLEKDHWLLYSAGTKAEPCGYSPGRKRESVINEGTDEETTVTINTPTGTFNDDAGFAYRSESRTELHVAVWVAAEATIPLGRIMWPQLEAGV